MTVDEYVQSILKAVDDGAMKLGKADYVDALDDVICDLESRQEAAQAELEADDAIADGEILEEDDE